MHTSPSKTEVRGMVGEKVLKKWQRAWDAEKCGRFRHMVQATLAPRQRRKLSRRNDVLLTRLRLGTARLAQWRSRVLTDGDGTCEECDAAPETMRHLLCDCTGWTCERDAMWETIARSTSCDIAEEFRSASVLLDSSDIGRGGHLLARLQAIRTFLQATRRLEWVSMAG